jgi:hypothetical protein
MVLFIVVPCLFIGWVAYFTFSSTSSLPLYFLIPATLLGIGLVRSGLKRAAAVNNAVSAAATFQTLPGPVQHHVEMQAIAILDRLHRPINGLDMMVHTARWGWYALAMRELGIPPVGELRRWNLVANPLLAVKPNDPYVRITIDRLQQKGFPVNPSLFED